MSPTSDGALASRHISLGSLGNVLIPFLLSGPCQKSKGKQTKTTMKKLFVLNGKTAREEHMALLHPYALMMFAWTNTWCLSHGITPVWTSLIRTPEENRAVGAKSITHVEGRALDLSYRDDWGWTRKLRAKFEREFNKEFKHIGAQVWDDDGDLISRPLVGSRQGHDHFHLQCRPGIKKVK